MVARWNCDEEGSDVPLRICLATVPDRAALCRDPRRLLDCCWLRWVSRGGCLVSCGLAAGGVRRTGCCPW
eukprot:12368746-Alexandrium_andersonii.AAC.1